MRKLGEQWVEEFDGKNHMLKAIENTTGGCKGCDLEVVENCYGSCGAGDGCNFIIKDLGILNEDGCLPSSWGGYPEVIRVGKPNFVTYFRVSLVVKYSDGSGIQVHVTGKTRQQAIDAWNRRV